MIMPHIIPARPQPDIVSFFLSLFMFPALLDMNFEFSINNYPFRQHLQEKGAKYEAQSAKRGGAGKGRVGDKSPTQRTGEGFLLKLGTAPPTPPADKASHVCFIGLLKILVRMTVQYYR